MAEVLFEQFYYGRAEKLTIAREKVVKHLIFFELLNTLLALRRYWRECRKSTRAIYFSETNDLVAEDEREQKEAEKFVELFEADKFVQLRGKNVTELKQLIREDLDCLRQEENGLHKQGAYNTCYEEVLAKSNKRISFEEELPIPPEILNQKNISSEEALKIEFGELLYIIRPLFYALLLMLCGLRSTKPFFLSLLVDLVRIILQREICFHKKSEKEEYSMRNLKMALEYWLRPPFMESVLERFVIPITVLVTNNRLRNILIAFLYFPLSLSLVI